MSSYSFEHIAGSSEIDFSNNVIWVFHADKIPPHIGFSAEQLFYSLKVSGKDEHLSTQSVSELIQRKKIPTLFIQLRSNKSLEDVQTAYEQFERAVFGSITCLTPIRNVFSQPEARQLSELLHRLEDQIEKVAGLYLPPGYKALPSYSIDDIHSYIQQLSSHDLER